jgi:hypothetical protein
MNILYSKNAKYETDIEDTLLQPSIVIQRDPQYLYSLIMVNSQLSVPYFINWMMINISINQGTFQEIIHYYPPTQSCTYQFFLFQQPSFIKYDIPYRRSFSLQYWIHKNGVQLKDTCDMNITNNITNKVST